MTHPDVEKVYGLVELIREHCIRRQTKLIAHNCSICNYPCGFFWDENNNLVYDSGCFCTKKQYLEVRPIKDIVSFISDNVGTVSQFLLECKGDLN